MRIKKCFGIISWFPDDVKARAQRIARFEQLLKQLNCYWPTTPIMIIAQNWGNYTTPIINNPLIIHHAGKLGITGARKELRKKFLESDFQFLITLDDDTIIKINSQKDAYDIMLTVDSNRNGFSFRRGPDTIPGTIYGPGHLIFAFISRKILEELDFPDISAADEEGYEDCIYAHLCYYVHPELEFDYPKGIKIDFFEIQRGIPSTWYHNKNFNKIQNNTAKILQYIKENKAMPPLEFYSRRSK